MQSVEMQSVEMQSVERPRPRVTENVFRQNLNTVIIVNSSQ